MSIILEIAIQWDANRIRNINDDWRENLGITGNSIAEWFKDAGREAMRVPLLGFRLLNIFNVFSDIDIYNRIALAFSTAVRTIFNGAALAYSAIAALLRTTEKTRSFGKRMMQELYKVEYRWDRWEAIKDPETTMRADYRGLPLANGLDAYVLAKAFPNADWMQPKEVEEQEDAPYMALADEPEAAVQPQFVQVRVPVEGGDEILVVRDRLHEGGEAEIPAGDEVQLIGGIDEPQEEGDLADLLEMDDADLPDGLQPGANAEIIGEQGEEEPD